MRGIATRSLTLGLWAAAVLLVLGLAYVVVLDFRNPSEGDLKRLTFELEVIKTILAGVIVTLLGILIPAVVTETRDRFEQRKDSRIAYSRAKTANDYLKVRLASADFAKACQMVQDAHFRKHLAELFDDFPEWLKRRYTYIKLQEGQTLQKWWDVTMYERLSRTRAILEQNALQWASLDAAQRIKLLDPVLPDI